MKVGGAGNDRFPASPQKRSFNMPHCHAISDQLVKLHKFRVHTGNINTYVELKLKRYKVSFFLSGFSYYIFVFFVVFTLITVKEMRIQFILTKNFQ